MELKRASGVLMHISSLPGGYSIGSLGRAAYRFVDFLSDSGFTYWQTLPICMTDECNSPYKSPSSIGVNPWFIDLPTLEEAGLITSEELSDARERTPYVAEYKRLSEDRLDLLLKASLRVKNKSKIKKFIDSRPELSVSARYLALSETYNGAPWREWDDERQPDENRLFLWQFIHYEFVRQWQKLREYANSKGVLLIGDVPIYTAYESAEVWSSPESFQLDADMMPREVAGVPPDYFSEDGQLWGNPLYDFARMKRDGYALWHDRMNSVLSFFDGVRIDHFRAIDEYYSIPRDAESAKEGRWRKGPGRDFIRKIREWAGDKLIIAEDLGDITDSVRDLLKYSGFPGMRVLQFAFLGKDSIHLPHNLENNVFAYTGTHDNNTLLGYIWELDETARRRLFDYFGIRHNDWSAAVFDIIKGLFSSSARTVMLPVQDLLGFGSDTRMNTPGSSSGNWTFRITEDNLSALSENSGKWKYINELYGRI